MSLQRTPRSRASNPRNEAEFSIDLPKQCQPRFTKHRIRNPFAVSWNRGDRSDEIESLAAVTGSGGCVTARKQSGSVFGSGERACHATPEKRDTLRRAPVNCHQLLTQFRGTAQPEEGQRAQGRIVEGQGPAPCRISRFASANWSGPLVPACTDVYLPLPLLGAPCLRTFLAGMRLAWLSPTELYERPV